MSKKHATIYTRFLQIAEQVRASGAFPKLDPIEERLLNQIAAAWFEGEKVPVLRAMELLPDVSGTTIHRRLKTLRSKRMLQLKPDETDERIRYVVPTDLANQYFEKLGRCLEQSARTVD